MSRLCTVRFGFGRTTLADEGRRLARQAVEALDAARGEEAECRAARARSEAAGDAAAAQRWLDSAEAAATRASRAREDEVAALQIVADAATEKLGTLRMTAEREEIKVNATARRAFGYRRIATAAATSLEEVREREQMRDALNEWAQQQAQQKLADGYRAAVEAAWAQTLGDESRESANSEADAWAAQLSVVDLDELQQDPTPPSPPFLSVGQRSTFSTASSALAKAEEEERAAQRWAAQLQATRQRQEDARQELDALDREMAKKTAAADERALRDSDDLRSALEMAMFRSPTGGEDDQETDEDQPPSASDEKLRRIAELEAAIAELRKDAPP